MITTRQKQKIADALLNGKTLKQAYRKAGVDADAIRRKDRNEIRSVGIDRLRDEASYGILWANTFSEGKLTTGIAKLSKILH
jgi:hypothetical protein